MEKPLEEKPRIMTIKSMKLETMSKQKINFRSNLFRIDYINEKKQKRSVVYSVDDGVVYQEWIKKIREMIKDFK